MVLGMEQSEPLKHNREKRLP